MQCDEEAFVVADVVSHRAFDSVAQASRPPVEGTWKKHDGAVETIHMHFDAFHIRL